MTDQQFEEKFLERNVADLCKEYDRIRGANVNSARITPEIIDGLKPVQRRTLVAMFESKDKGEKFRKVASITGDTFGKYHPHSPTSITDALVGIAQWWHNTIPLIEGSGNFGTVSGDPAGADRYIKARLSEYAKACFFDNWDDAVIDTVMAANEEDKEPLYLPAKYPNVLLNGTIGIGYGLGSNIPCYNFRELVRACMLLMTNPDADIILIPDSPTGADIIECDFGKICRSGSGTYRQRCTYEIDPVKNIIKITTLPYLVTVNSIREKIAEIKENNGLPELISMDDRSKANVDLDLILRDDANPYKFMKKLIKEVAGLEKPYPVNIVIVSDYNTLDYPIKDALLSWIRWAREQKRTVTSHKRTRLISDQRMNDVKLFIMSKENLNSTIEIFKTSRNRSEIERRLMEKYHNSPIKMDSLQTRTLSNMRLVDLSLDAYDEYLKRKEEINNELEVVEKILNTPGGIDEEIIADLKDGDKRFGIPRRSNVVSYEIKTSSDVSGTCILQLSSDGMINRRIATNIDEEPIPTDSNGFAVKVDNDSSFILIDNKGYHSFIKVNDIPIDSDVPVNRYSRQILDGDIIAMLPIDFDVDRCCTLVSKYGLIKRIRVSDMKPSKRPCIDLIDNDKVIKGIVTLTKSQKDILIYTKEGMGQRLDPNSIRVTSPIAKGGNGFKLMDEDEIVGCYSIDPEENRYLLYVTTKGKMRLNLIDYLPKRDSKHDAMVRLISLNDRDKLLSIVGCNKHDKLQVFFDDGSNEIIDISKMTESTMSEDPKKLTSKNAVTTNVVKVKLV